MTNNALLPCPFCGGKAVVYRDKAVDIYCIDCSCLGGSYDTELEAIEAWNTRTQSSADPDLLDALRFITTCSHPLSPQQEECWIAMRRAIARATGGEE